jgi:hypothetical protein
MILGLGFFFFKEKEKEEVKQIDCFTMDEICILDKDCHSKYDKLKGCIIVNKKLKCFCAKQE